ncbi:MAG: hypothetical protein WD969_06930 [Paracoccaceae bacterium]
MGKWFLAAMAFALFLGAAAETPCSLKAPRTVGEGEYTLAVQSYQEGSTTS